MASLSFCEVVNCRTPTSGERRLALHALQSEHPLGPPFVCYDVIDSCLPFRTTTLGIRPCFLFDSVDARLDRTFPRFFSAAALHPVYYAHTHWSSFFLFVYRSLVRLTSLLYAPFFQGNLAPRTSSLSRVVPIRRTAFSRTGLIL